MSNNIDSMNEQDFSSLLASVDDEADHHVLWVNTSGQVFLEPSGGLSPTDFDNKPGFKFRWETMARGNGYCGANAASDMNYVRKQLAEVKADWSQGKTGYVDY